MYSMFVAVQPLSFLTLCDPMDCNTPGFPAFYHPPEFVPTHVHCIDDVIQPSCPLSSPSPPAFNLRSIRVFFNELALHIRWPKYWSFSFSVSPSNEYSGLIFFRTLKCFLQHHNSKTSIFQCSTFFMVQLSHLPMTAGKP